ncbi:hypothetical protein [Tropicibacter alexandrii]|uniref:hypothetical protein n=1 Tax=Tropicibacter alexandrii TaxID=2267683 RepID=UPI000EF44A3B|nr:hypothetical protein [Tropicibacter alexandrii]
MSPKSKPTLVWALYASSLAAGLTSFVGVALAYLWRSGDPEFKAVYDKQIRRFWMAGLGWILGILVIVATVATDTTPAGSGMPGMGYVGVLIIVLTQLWFGISALVSIVATLWSGNTPAAPRSVA